ncbi:MAG: hypothetical protein AB8B54_04490 [Sphingorhabdus sp.]
MQIKPSSKAIGFAAAMLFATASVQAQPAADNFTFQSSSNPATVVGSDGTGPNPYTGTFLTGTIQTAFESGETRNGTFSCVSMTQPPNGKLFDMHMLCDGTDKQGTYSATFGCTIINAATENFSCVGGLYGKSGAYAGRGGTATNHSLGGKASGTGQWYK